MHCQLSRRFIFVPISVLLAMGFCIARGSGLGTALAQAPGKPAENRPVLVIDRPPVRIIEDNHPTFNAIAMDMKRGEVFLANSNEASNPGIFVYPAQFPPTDRVIEPRRIIAGAKPGLGQTCGVAVSPEYMELYAVEGDGGDLKVFPLG